MTDAVFLSLNEVMDIDPPVAAAASVPLSADFSARRRCLPRRLPAATLLHWLVSGAAALALLCRGPDRYRFIAGWWLLAWGTVTVWIPFSRLRYAAPLLLPSLLLVLGTLCWVWERRRTGRRALRAGQSGSG